MTLSSTTRHKARYLVPLGAAVVTAAIVLIPQAASGAQHPDLPPQTAAQLLAALERAKVPQFSGTTVETTRLGLPSLDDVNLPGAISTGDGSPLTQIVTLLTGSHTAQLAYGGPDKQRIAIFLSDLSETDIVHNGTDVWTYSSDSNSVSHSTVKSDSGETQTPEAADPVDPTKAAEKALAEIDPSTKVTVDRTAEVAGRPAYQLDLTPRDDRTLVGSVRIALDSATSLPLRVEIWSRNNTSTPAFSVGFTSISMKAPSASTFDFTKPPTAAMQSSPLEGPVPAGVHVKGGEGPSMPKFAHDSVVGKDWTSVFIGQLASSTDPVAAVGPNGGAVSGPNGGESLTGLLDTLGTQVAGGHLITTTLLSILITDDNRVLVGAVTPAYLEQVAANQAAQ
ncbi:MAG TPA: sigma-E factor regulatory protein RseB domain-containing protein [Mycobacteriales bacterium]|jgi:outer membrane lipoprotein-sorting protein|nr:sigma-E factor regulatory protein RseB domain-containing protein [Mycobacteriales bacterium]